MLFLRGKIREFINKIIERNPEYRDKVNQALNTSPNNFTLALSKIPKKLVAKSE